jgi:uncharacterized protein YwgA
MKMQELSSKDFLLTLLYCPINDNKMNVPITGRTKLTKMVFLFDKEIKKDFFNNIQLNLPGFLPYHFGPFSKELFDDLNFFISIGFILTEETTIPLSNVEKQEIAMAVDDDWANAGFEDTEQDSVELMYKLSPHGESYVKDKVWDLFSEFQKRILIDFKKQINAISLDSLLRYVYNKYPDYTGKSIIADKYLENEGGS